MEQQGHQHLPDISAATLGLYELTGRKKSVWTDPAQGPSLKGIVVMTDKDQDTAEGIVAPEETSTAEAVSIVIGLVLVFGVLAGGAMWCFNAIFIAIFTTIRDDNGDGDAGRSRYVNLADHTSTICPSFMSEVIREWRMRGEDQNANDWTMRNVAAHLLSRMA